MKSLTRVGAVLGSVFGLAGALGGLVVGCGGDDTVAAVDSGVDATTDTGSGADTGADTRVDTGADTGADTGIDTGVDTGIDTGVDGGKPDTGVKDSGPLPDVAPPPDPSLFPGQVVTALCQRYRECCGISAAGWDQARCESTNSNGGGFKNLGSHLAGLVGDAGTLVNYDTTLAQTCLQDILSFTCPPPAQTSAEYQKARDDCYAALKGTIPLNGTGCTDDIQCAAGHCVGGTCGDLFPQGHACTKTDDCAYRGTSTPNMFCDNVDPDAGGTCVPRLADGVSCSQYWDWDYAACSGGLCDIGSGTCASSSPYVDPGTCTFFAKDAGTD